MRVLAVVHERNAGSGVFGDVLRERGEDVLEWRPPEGDPAPAGPFDAVLVFGGAMNCEQEPELEWLGREKRHLRDLFAARTPALGVCLGAQLLAEAAGGRVMRMPAAEIGWKPVRLEPGAHDPVLGTLPDGFEALQWHSFEFTLPPGATVLARSSACVEAFRCDHAPWWGIQFHAEVTGEAIGDWIDEYRSDPDAVAADLDWTALRVRSRQEISRWNEQGARLCTAFLEHATTPNPSR